MPRSVAFLRAINVGGHTVTNARLADLFAELELGDPTPYQASGNVVFDAEGDPAVLETRIEDHLAAALGYEVVTFVRSVPEVAALADASPFPDPPTGAKLHVAFLKRPPTDDELAAVTELITDTATSVAAGRELWWALTDGFANSPLATPALSRALTQPTTLRTRTTLTRLARKFSTP
ncbi:MAG: DUF1697 domain-containing protein [Actinobacteria bacterium]|nr:DUF1697 domain-containing protein [Actinomycetota bacterium]